MSETKYSSNKLGNAVVFKIDLIAGSLINNLLIDNSQ